MAKTEEVQITGRLEEWRYDRHNHVLWGMVYDDILQRFEDGMWIHTSWLRHNAVDIGKFKEGDIVHTRNSKYLLGKKYYEPVQPASTLTSAEIDAINTLLNRV